VFGSGKGWAGALLYNDKANTAIRNFYSRADTLSLGICNGCQVMTELGLIYPDHKEHPKMKNNDSGKFESAFLTVDILPNNSVMLKSLTGSRLGIWLANGEGRFHFPQDESNYCIPIKYSYQKYPGNPNGSPFGAAGIVSYDGRHLAMMPHIERAIFPWQWPYYPEKRKTDQVSPWFEAFVNAREWLTEKLKA
jgi:phosphoribosylformylglycinamidine synthase